MEVEAVRGVGCGPVLRTLLERGSVRVTGRRTDVLGQPPLYDTTEDFLKEFGLASLEELPMLQELRELTGAKDPLSAPQGDAAPELHIVEREEEQPEAATEETSESEETTPTENNTADAEEREE